MAEKLGRWRLGYAEASNPNRARAAAFAAGLGYLGVIAPLITVIFPHDDPVHWQAFGVVVALAAAEGTVMALDLRRLLGDSYRAPSARKTTIELVVAVIAAALTDYALGGGHGTYRPLIIPGVLIAATIGNSLMIGIVWTTAVISLAIATVAGGAPIWSATNAVIAFGAVALAAAGMMREVRDAALRAADRFDRLIDTTEVILRAEGFDEALARFLPLVATQADARRVDAFRWEPEGSYSLAGTWPAADPSEDPRDHRSDANESFVPDAPGEGTNGSTILEDHTAIWARAVDGTSLVLIVWRPEPSFRKRVSYGFAIGQLAAELDLLVRYTDFLVRLDELGRTDALTGLANRRELMERLDREIALATRRGGRLVLAMIDLDHFKDYNDTFGHLEGDRALVDLAGLLRERMRATDIVGRYGGEEFVILLPDADVEGACQLLGTLSAYVRELSARRPLTFSAGVALWDGSEDVGSLLRRADTALYEAKAAGRDRVVVASVGSVAPI